MDIIGSIEADTGCDGNKYQFVEQTESNRLMRGAWEADSGGAEAPQALQAIHQRCTAGDAKNMQRRCIRDAPQEKHYRRYIKDVPQGIHPRALLRTKEF